MVIGIFGDSILGPDGAKTQRIENRKESQGSVETYSRHLRWLKEPVCHGSDRIATLAHQC